MTPTGLPNADLDTSKPLGARFAAQGAWTFRDAARLVWDLPFGRPRHSGPDAVLRSGRGTGCDKHALLAALAQEVGLPVELRLGLYVMTGDNTRGVERALRAHRVEAVPEAHCVLAVGDDRVDLTWPGRHTPIPPFSEEVAIGPDQAGAYKRRWHRERVDAWAQARDLDADRLWAAREAAIDALSQ